MEKFLQKKIEKKIFAAFICVSIVLSLATGVFLNKGLKADAAGNPYAKTYVYNSKTYLNCTWYAWQRAYEKLNVALPGFRNNAVGWYAGASAAGYSVGAEPSDNSIAVWSGGFSECEHVAFVESVSGNNINITQGGFGSNVNTSTYTKTSIKSIGVSGGSPLKLLGYIYLSGGSSASAPVSASGTWKITATDGVNVRSEAGTGYSKVGFYAYNTVVTIYEKATANGYTWGHTSHGWFVLDYAEPVFVDFE